jgi:hypothetical protein
MTAEEDPLEYLWSLWPMLLCPLLMGPMMWLAMRVNGSREAPPETDLREPGVATSVGVGAAVGDRLAALRAELEEIGSQQAAIAAQIERLSAEGRPAVPGEPVPTEPTPGTS